MSYGLFHIVLDRVFFEKVSSKLTFFLGTNSIENVSIQRAKPQNNGRT